MGRLDDDRLEGKLLLFAADLLTVLLLTVGSAISFTSGYGLALDLGAVVVFCVFAGTVSTVLHGLRRPWWPLGVGLGIALLFRLTWEKISPTLEWIVWKMGLLPASTEFPLSDYPPDRDEMLPAVLLICAVLAWFMGWAAVRVRRWYLAALLPLVLVMPAIQSGVLPAWGAMLAVFAGWGSMLLTSLYSRKDPESLGRAQFLSLGGIAALIVILAAALPMRGYIRPQWATNTRIAMITGISRRLERFMDLDELNYGILADLGIDLSLDSQDGASGGPGGAGLESGGTTEREDLLHAGPQRYTGQRVLTLRTNQENGGRIHLRGNSLGVYTGTSWEMVEGNGYPFFASEFSDEPEAQPSLYPAATSDGLGYTMSIRDILHRGVNYYPYFPALETEWFSESGLLTLPDEYDPVNQLEYQVTYVPKSPAEIFWPLAGRYAVEEASYRRDVVYPNYLDVPEGARESLSALLHGSPDGSPTLDDFGGPAALWEGMDTVSRFEAVITASSRTAALLDALAVYDPETPAMPENESDFASWFLTEGRGYCVHFATAGALLLRMQGIPARYVTGYTVWLNANGQGEALDSDAHAWVEVYIDGYGWYPVEMTPGYAGGTDGVTLIGSEAEASPDESDVPEEETPEEEPEPPEEESEELPEEAGLPGEAPVEDEPGFVFPWKAVLGVVLTLGALAGGYVLSYLPRKLERENADTNRSVICAYRRYSRSLRWGGEPDETIEELGRKAKFSQHILTEEERETAWKSLDASAERVRARLPKRRKFLFPLMKPLL